MITSVVVHFSNATAPVIKLVAGCHITQGTALLGPADGVAAMSYNHAPFIGPNVSLAVLCCV